MTDASQPTEPTEPKPADDPTTEAPELPEEWKPEPREWTWKDVFTAPMLAFKPKCMLISVITLIVLGVFGWAWGEIDTRLDDVPVVGPVLCWICLALMAVLFSLGTTLVSVFFKADLLDDEFLSCGEAIGQFKGRIKAAIMVPLFLVGLVAGFNLVIYLCELIGSIPFLGPTLYALLYPLGWLLALLTVLLTIATLLAVFVGPAVLAVRKHGWFDNVIDVFEAVGTKPHQLVGNFILTGIMVLICGVIPSLGICHLAVTAQSDAMFTDDLAETERASSQHLGSWVPQITLLKTGVEVFLGIEHDQAEAHSATRPTPGTGTWSSDPADDEAADGDGVSGYPWFAGLVTAAWKLLIIAGIVGYCWNVFIAGGMLTYLAVREDDYWDDEDLEDLDKLAKELEEEAKREAEAAEAEATSDTPAAAAPTPEASKDEGEKQDGGSADGQKDEDQPTASTDNERQEDGSSTGKDDAEGEKKDDAEGEKKDDAEGEKKDESDESKDGQPTDAEAGQKDEDDDKEDEKKKDDDKKDDDKKD